MKNKIEQLCFDKEEIQQNNRYKYTLTEVIDRIHCATTGSSGEYVDFPEVKSLMVWLEKRVENWLDKCSHTPEYDNLLKQLCEWNKQTIKDATKVND